MPIHPFASEPNAETPPAVDGAGPSGRKRFRIALSFAGEKRAFVKAVALQLAAVFGEEQILYDHFHEAEFARDDLAFHLPGLYNDQSDLVVAVLCQDYLGKDWCGLEWKALYGLIKGRQDSNRIMLSRFDRAQGQGLFGLAGYIDLDDLSPRHAARLILDRLAINENLPKHHYALHPEAGDVDASTDDWPDKPPELHWPVADHSVARDAFARLITRQSPARLLSISGASETGKTHLSKQFLGNAMQIASVSCGRLDFKGGTGLDLEGFALQLGVPPPRPGPVSSQLAHILSSLIKRAKPTLLVFDTFEMAMEVAPWIKDNLLLALIRSPWLRVVIVGQKTVSAQGEPWASRSAPPISLTSPTVADWFHFGNLHKRGLTLELVQTMHDLAPGRNMALAQLLGPET